MEQSRSMTSEEMKKANGNYDVRGSFGRGYGIHNNSAAGKANHDLMIHINSNS